MRRLLTETSHVSIKNGVFDDIFDAERLTMRTTVTIEDALFEEAKRVTKAIKPSEVFHLSLQALIKQEKAKRLAALGGSLPDFQTPVRNR